MTWKALPDCSIYPPEDVTRETGVRLDPTRLDGSDYLALVQALEEGELTGRVEWRSPSGRLVVAERIRFNGKNGVVWRDSTLVGVGRRSAYGEKPACKSQRGHSESFQNKLKRRSMRAEMALRVSRGE